jgi:hypothetical protein
MINTRIKIVAVCVAGLLLVFESGCAVLSLPGQALNMVGSLAGEIFKLAGNLPSPPPGVFF